ncbi:MAG: hypothetical protein NVS9B4_01270 [Candidatus Acidiferrum sp.]
MTRAEFNASAAACAAHPDAILERHQFAKRFCTADRYCGYHGALNVELAVIEAKLQIAKALEANQQQCVDAGLLNSLSLEERMAASTAIAQYRKARKAEVSQ